jgi:hypothetical protein
MATDFGLVYESLNNRHTAEVPVTFDNETLVVPKSWKPQSIAAWTRRVVDQDLTNANRNRKECRTEASKIALLALATCFDTSNSYPLLVHKSQLVGEKVSVGTDGEGNPSSPLTTILDDYWPQNTATGGAIVAADSTGRYYMRIEFDLENWEGTDPWSYIRNCVLRRTGVDLMTVPDKDSELEATQIIAVLTTLDQWSARSGKLPGIMQAAYLMRVFVPEPDQVDINELKYTSFADFMARILNLVSEWDRYQSVFDGSSSFKVGPAERIAIQQIRRGIDINYY